MMWVATVNNVFWGNNPNFRHGWKVQSLNNRTNIFNTNTGEDDALADKADKTRNESHIDHIEG